MIRPSNLEDLVGVLETDRGFYLAMGVLTVVVFLVALVLVSFISPVSLTGGGFTGILVGFGLFMAVFFVSIVALRLEGGD